MMEHIAGVLLGIFLAEQIFKWEDRRHARWRVRQKFLTERRFRVMKAAHCHLYKQTNPTPALPKKD